MFWKKKKKKIKEEDIIYLGEEVAKFLARIYIGGLFFTGKKVFWAYNKLWIKGITEIIKSPYTITKKIIKKIF